jgi:hypothetical protein
MGNVERPAKYHPIVSTARPCLATQRVADARLDNIVAVLAALHAHLQSNHILPNLQTPNFRLCSSQSAGIAPVSFVWEKPSGYIGAEGKRGIRSAKESETRMTLISPFGTRLPQGDHALA